MRLASTAHRGGYYFVIRSVDVENITTDTPSNCLKPQLSSIAREGALSCATNSIVDPAPSSVTAARLQSASMYLPSPRPRNAGSTAIRPTHAELLNGLWLLWVMAAKPAATILSFAPCKAINRPGKSLPSRASVENGETP